MYIACGHLSSDQALTLIASTAEEREPRDEIRWQLPLSLYDLSARVRVRVRVRVHNGLTLALFPTSSADVKYQPRNINVLCGHEL